MTAQKHTCIAPLASAAVLALAVGALGFAACSQGREAGNQRSTPPGIQREGVAAPRVQMELASDAKLDRSAQADLTGAARRFASTLAGWLYGRRREVDVEPVTAQLREELAVAAPYIPVDQIGSADGQATRVRVSVQTPRSGVLVVTIHDSRTRYAIPASFELRAGCWRVVHLNMH